MFPVRSDISPTPALIHRELIRFPGEVLKKVREISWSHNLTVTEVITSVLLLAKATVVERHYHFLDQPKPDIIGSAFFPADGRRYMTESENPKDYAGNAVVFAHMGIPLDSLKRTLEDSGCLKPGKLTIGKTFWDEFAMILREGWKDGKVRPSF